jgi:Glycosyltransferases involved in cell wall biogenesis
MKLFVLLPSYNEGEALPFLLSSFHDLLEEPEYGYEIVVIDDGSTDNTVDAANSWRDRLNIRVVSHEKNMGLGGAVNTGLAYFYENCSDDDVAIIMDADNTHNPCLIPSMIDKIKSGSDVVIASRYEPAGREIGLSALRRLCSAGASMLLSFAFRIPGVRDYTCGYRAYSERIIKKAVDIYGSNFIEEKGFTCMAEILIKLSFLGYEISEVPLILRYDLKKGRSKMKVCRTILGYFSLIRNVRHYKQYVLTRPAFINGKEK